MSGVTKLLEDISQSSETVIVHQIGMCVECLDQPASVICEVCDDDYCDVCFGALHRKGKRSSHKSKPYQPPTSTTSIDEMSDNEDNDKEMIHDKKKEKVVESIYDSRVVDMNEDFDIDEYETKDDVPTNILNCFDFFPAFKQRITYVPVRLDERERNLLRILEDTLSVSEYTDQVDNIQLSNRAALQVDGINTVLSTLSGMVLANNTRLGKRVLNSESFQENADMFQELFEIGRRYKICNPEKMRSTHGKLLAIVTDSCHPSISNQLGFNLRKPIKLVKSQLKEYNCEGLLKEPLLELAVSQIKRHLPTDADRDLAIRVRTAICEDYVRKYSKLHSEVTGDMILMWLSSLRDHSAYIQQAVRPIDAMFNRLNYYFKPNEKGEVIIDKKLSITTGRNGARLTHNHETQILFVEQTFTLWRLISIHMYQLWFESDTDLIDSPRYSLRFTGQGIHRMSSAPRVGNTMSRILDIAFRSTHHSWIGSSAVHLGDTNVPNALVFIDKYTQIERILEPIDRTLREIENAKTLNHPTLKPFFESYYPDHDTKQLHVTIMTDFFKHAFDGSGAEDYFSAGSCIDGRLTSAWNWCSKISGKTYYMAFLATGFIGFDG